MEASTIDCTKRQRGVTVEAGISLLTTKNVDILDVSFASNQVAAMVWLEKLYERNEGQRHDDFL